MFNANGGQTTGHCSTKAQVIADADNGRPRADPTPIDDGMMDVSGDLGEIWSEDERREFGLLLGQQVVERQAGPSQAQPLPALSQQLPLGPSPAQVSPPTLPLPSAADVSRDPTDVQGLQMLVSRLRDHIDGLGSHNQALERGREKLENQLDRANVAIERLKRESEEAMSAVQMEFTALLTERETEAMATAAENDRKINGLKNLCRQLSAKLKETLALLHSEQSARALAEQRVAELLRDASAREVPMPPVVDDDADETEYPEPGSFLARVKRECAAVVAADRHARATRADRAIGDRTPPSPAHAPALPPAECASSAAPAASAPSYAIVTPPSPTGSCTPPVTARGEPQRPPACSARSAQGLVVAPELAGGCGPGAGGCSPRAGGASGGSSAASAAACGVRVPNEFGGASATPAHSSQGSVLPGGYDHQFSFDARNRQQIANDPTDGLDQLSHQLARMGIRIPLEIQGQVDELRESSHVSSTHFHEGSRRPSSTGQGFYPASSVPYGCVPPYPSHAPQYPSEESRSQSAKTYRESDTIVVPPLPANALEVRQWAMDVTAAVQAASGRQETVSLRVWLDDARKEVRDVDAVFDTTRTPPEFVSLESKLNVALREVLKAAKDQSLRQRIDHEDSLRWHRSQERFGGRRVFREILLFYQLSEHRVQMSALQAFWNLSWKGDSYQEMARFHHELCVTADAASRSGQSEAQLADKLASILVSSNRIRPAFHAYAQQRKLTGQPMRFHDLSDMVRDVVEEERRLINEQVLNPVSGRGKHRNPYHPAGPATDADGPPDSVLRRYQGYCQRHVVGKCKHGTACRFKHEPVPAIDAAAFRDACATKFARSGVDSPSEPGSPVGRPGAQSGARGPTVGVCRNWQSSLPCPALPNCRWRHGNSKEEHARVKALRDQERAAKQTAATPGTSTSAAAVPIGRAAA